LPKELRTEKGKIQVNDDLETSIPGVYAIGDNRTKGAGRIAGAVGDGAFAAKNVFDYFAREKAKREAGYKE